MFNNDCNNGKNNYINTTDKSCCSAYCICFTGSNIDCIQMCLEEIAKNSGNKQMH